MQEKREDARPKQGTDSGGHQTKQLTEDKQQIQRVYKQNTKHEIEGGGVR